jgi:uncharacterized repeat protein (TIGR01451 family)
MSSLTRFVILATLLMVGFVSCETCTDTSTPAPMVSHDGRDFSKELAERDRRISALEAHLSRLGNTTATSGSVEVRGLCGSDGTLSVNHSGPATATEGANVEYTITVTNSNNCPAVEAQVFAYLPRNARFVSASDGGSASGNTVRWSIAQFEAGESKTLRYTVQLTASGVYKLCVWATSRLLQCIETRIVTPKLACNWTGPSRARSNEVFEACLELSNTGDGEARGVAVRVRVDGGEFAEGGTTKTWNADVPAGQAVRNCWRFKSSRDGTLRVVAEISGTSVTCAKDVVVSTPDINVKKSGPPYATINSTFSYKIEVANTSSAVNTNVMLTDNLPDGMEFMEASDSGSYDAGSRSVRWSLGTMNAGASRTVTIRVKAVKEHSAPGWRNCATVQSAEAGPKEACANTVVEAVPAMHIDSFDTEDPVQLGDQTTYVVKVRNEGQKRATQVQLTFDCPEESTYVSHTAKRAGLNGRASGNTVTFDAVPVMEPGDSVVYEITVKAVRAGSAIGTATVRFAEFSKPFKVQEPTNMYE